MTLRSVPLNRLRSICTRFVAFAFVTTWALSPAFSQANLPKGTGCRIESADYKGWHAQQISNRWIQLVMVPQKGGRVIQVTFGGHPYLFVNPKFAGKYLPPFWGTMTSCIHR